MAILTLTELNQRITDLRQRLEVPPIFHIKEDFEKLVNFLSESTTYLYDAVITTGLDTVINTLISHVSNVSNPHNVTKSQLDLDNVNNTSDIDKPLSTATQEALDGYLSKTNSILFTPTGDYHPATKKYVDDSIILSGGYTNEAAQDAVGNILTNSNTIDFNYNDIEFTITADVKDKSIDENKLSTSVNESLDKADSAIQSADLADIATSGNYDDLLNTPFIPSQLSDLTEDTSHRIVSDIEKSTWNAKQNTLVADTDYLTPNTASNTYEPIDSSILRSSNIGSSIQGYNSNTVIDSNYVHTDNNFTSILKNKLDGIASGAEINTVDSVNTKTGSVVLDADDIDDTSTTNKFVTSNDLTNLSNLSGTNTGDQDLSGYVTKENAVFTNSPVVPAATADDHPLQAGQAFGFGASLYDVTENRTQGVTYSNTTGNLLTVTISIQDNETFGEVVVTPAGEPPISFPIGSSSDSSEVSVDLYLKRMISFIVPPLATYRLNAPGCTILRWAELFRVVTILAMITSIGANVLHQRGPLQVTSVGANVLHQRGPLQVSSVGVNILWRPIA